MNNIDALAPEQPENFNERDRIERRAHLEPERRNPARFGDLSELRARLTKQQTAKARRVEALELAQDPALLATEAERGFRVQDRNLPIVHPRTRTLYEDSTIFSRRRKFSRHNDRSVRPTHR